MKLDAYLIRDLQHCKTILGQMARDGVTIAEGIGLIDQAIEDDIKKYHVARCPSCNANRWRGKRVDGLMVFSCSSCRFSRLEGWL